MRSAVKMKVGRGSDWTELMEYFGEQKGKELSLSTVASLRTGRFCCCCYQVASVVSDSVRPHRWQPTRLCCPWNSPGKNTGVGCHFLLQCMRVKSESEVAQSCLTLRDPMDCSLPGSFIHGVFQARVLEWGCHCLLRGHWNLKKFQE